jgi:3-hydroxyisobutyrate dehydrogenase
MPAGGLWIDHTTTSARLARECCAACLARRIDFVDAPVSGGVAAAERGALSVMAGGAAAALERARAVLSAYAGEVFHLGPVGAGQLCKLANQLAIAGTLRGLAEAVELGRAVGIEVPTMLEALAAGSARSAQLLQHQERLAQKTFRFNRDFEWLRKDLELVQGALGSDGAPLARFVLTAWASHDG